MTPEQTAKLRAMAASHRLKAHAGHVGVAAARDAAHIVQRELAALVQRSIEDKSLAKRWIDAREKAREALSNLDNGGAVPEDELQLFAVAELLAWHGTEAKRIALVFADKVESDRRFAEGRGAGIEEALGLLSDERALSDEPAVSEGAAEVPQR